MNDPFAMFIAQSDTMRYTPSNRKPPWESQASVKTLEWMRKHGKPASSRELAGAMKVTRMAAKERLIVLRKAGLVVYEPQEGQRTMANPGVWSLTERGRG